MVDFSCMLHIDHYAGSLNFAIDFTRFSPGNHSLVITATATSGATSSFSTGFTVPEPLGTSAKTEYIYIVFFSFKTACIISFPIVLTCVQGAVSGRVEVTCSASKPLFQPLFCQVTADGGSPNNVPCKIHRCENVLLN